MSGFYLEDHPPRRRQFRKRYAKPTGLQVIHTAESVMDSVGPDTGAEAVARFIQGRTTPGSYHTLHDSDSSVRLVQYAYAAYGDGTGSNEYAIHHSAACRTTDWRRMSTARKEGFIRQMAKGAADANAWLHREHGVSTPARRVSKAQSSRGMAGFISHGERDPGRRTDPGADFPWDLFLKFYAEEIGETTQEDDDMALSKEGANEVRKIVREAVKEATKPAPAPNEVAAAVLELLRTDNFRNYLINAGIFPEQSPHSGETVRTALRKAFSEEDTDTTE